jgi:citrate lyase subunit beta/citryl-CoA lyase
MIVNSGNRGKEIRSDCYVEIETVQSGGLHVELSSKVESLYGRSIRELCTDMCQFFELSNAKVFIEDQGALPFVLAARLESAIKQVVKSDKEFILSNSKSAAATSNKKNYRRSRLYIPGNSPKLMINAGIYSSDGIILDLEDSVAPDKKQEAQYLVRNALHALDFGMSERMVRINQYPKGIDDLPFIVNHGVQVILVPKCENGKQLIEIDEHINKLQHKTDETIYLMPIIESALGVENAFEIASERKNVVAIAMGLEDLTADLGVERTNEANETFYARSKVVNAASAAGVQAIDSVFSDVANMEALKNTIVNSKAMGFTGMGCIHPRQIEYINRYYLPTEKEIRKAQKIVMAFHEAQAKGLGVVAVGSKMIDAPVVNRAMKSIQMALDAGIINENWREDYE